MIETAIGSFITQLADNPFLIIGFGRWVTGVFTYDLVSLLPWAYFQQEADAGSSWWLDPNGVAGDWSAMGIILSLIAALIIPICGVLAALSPEDGVILAGIAIGAEVAVIRLLPRVKAYIDQEEDVLGYTPS